MVSMLSGRARLIRATGVVGVVAVVILSVPTAPAWAESSESIASYDTAINVAADGILRVRETISYDFGDQERHGIIRHIPARVHADATHDRIYPIDAVSVTMDGAPTPLVRVSDGGEELVRLGDPDTPITGRHTYVLDYTVRGALNGFNDHDELYWNVVGTEWSVPIERATANVTGPASITRVDCFAGAADSRFACSRSSIANTTATFGPQRLDPNSGLTVVAAFPKGTVANIAPVLVARRDAAAAFRLTPLTVGLAVGLAVLGVALALLLAWRVGRDRRYLGLLPGLAPGYGESAVEGRKPLLGAPPVSVEFGPPEDVRPGQVGAMIDERADARDVAASVVDFAVRRHLHIKELPPVVGKASDWEFTRLTDGDPAFLPYERTLFDALFAAGDVVKLSELRGTIALPIRQVRRELYQDMVDRGWYHRSPADIRVRAYLLAGLGVLAAIVVTAVLAFTTHIAAAGAGLVVAALAMLAIAGRIPARTGRGSAILARIQGFRLYIATAEAQQLRWQEREQIFSTFLPYAIVFGLVDRWAATFADLGVLYASGGAVYWYTVAPGSGNFHQSINGFSQQVSMVGSPIGVASGSSAGGSGFSGGSVGGGGGGGGGGSW